MNSLHYHSKSRTAAPLCCTPTQAWDWARCLAELAVVYGDDDSRRALPKAVQHYLDALRHIGVPR